MSSNYLSSIRNKKYDQEIVIRRPHKLFNGHRMWKPLVCSSQHSSSLSFFLLSTYTSFTSLRLLSKLTFFFYHLDSFDLVCCKNSICVKFAYWFHNLFFPILSFYWSFYLCNMCYILLNQINSSHSPFSLDSKLYLPIFYLSISLSFTF